MTQKNITTHKQLDFFLIQTKLDESNSLLIIGLTKRARVSHSCYIYHSLKAVQIVHEASNPMITNFPRFHTTDIPGSLPDS